MKETDQIIRYLAGDMDEVEKAGIEQRITSDPGFRQAFDEIEKIWEMMKDSLTLEGLSGEESREEVIAEVLAEQDILQYRSRSPSSREESLRKLMKAIEKNEGNADTGKKSMRLLNYRNSLFLAAAVILMFVLIRPGAGPVQLAQEYFRPADIQLLNENLIQTRSENYRVFQLFSEEKYGAAKTMIERQEIPGEREPLTSLVYSIACFETADTAKAIDVLEQLVYSGNQDIAYESSWYLSLILVRNNTPADALPLLRKLAEEEGPYQKKSRKLIRVINRQSTNR